MVEPGRLIRSVGDLLVVLQAMEQEAAARYAALAEQMQTRGSTELAAIFRQLSMEEQGHIQQVAHWREKSIEQLGNLLEVPAPQASPTADDMAELVASAALTPYRALVLAVRAEERAFAFWTYVAAQAPSLAVQEAAEKVAHQELEHAALLRHERRRAYHAEQTETARPAKAASPSALLQQARQVERSLLAVFERMASEPGENSIAGRGLVRTTEALVANLEALVQRNSQTPSLGGSLEERPSPSEALLMAKVEEAVEIYLNLAEQSPDEAVVAAAQSLAGRAITRLSRLHAYRPNTVVQPFRGEQS